MIFEEEFPKAKYLDTLTKFDDIMKGRHQHPCWQCGRLTSFLEINFEAYTCSDECADAGWAEYINATWGE
jgi:hypothetical protein